MKKLNNSAPSGVSYTEDWLPIRQIMNGMIQLDDGSYVTGVKVAPEKYIYYGPRDTTKYNLST